MAISGTVSTSTGSRSGRRTRRRSLAGALAAAALALGGVVATAGPAAALTHADAAAQLSAAGIGISSSGGCTDRGTPTCTSLDGVRQATVSGAVTLAGASGCSLTVTGGTEVGHADGTYSHHNGYKLDFSLSSCLTSYVTSTFTYVGERGDGAALYRAGSGNEYAREGSHWDVTFYSCGGC
ncbi:hypothetical protein RDV89_10370 [Nocardioides zeae]|uniref:Peptidoglycan-binding protein n=1 Tax=Nocardioides imazamoxiresistens TaxID=3231893 RepID=A0ABU3PW60_9ACTN|nr:hypothetical protein [Nocardioides zeae]MDT9593471.1 hypothetical protein [Nocardioides zeae]